MTALRQFQCVFGIVLVLKRLHFNHVECKSNRKASNLLNTIRMLSEKWKKVINLGHRTLPPSTIYICMCFVLDEAIIIIIIMYTKIWGSVTNIEIQAIAKSIAAKWKFHRLFSFNSTQVEVTAAKKPNHFLWIH